MSQLELESLLSYEHNLAACYEAEYVMQLSMQREQSTATNWPRYEDTSEARVMTSPSFPRPALTQAHSRATNSAAEGVDVHNSHLTAQYISGTPMMNTDLHHNSHHAHSSLHCLTNSVTCTSANPPCINGFHRMNGLPPAPQFTHTQQKVLCPSSLSECHVAGGHGGSLSVKLCQSESHDNHMSHCDNHMMSQCESHCDGPQRKKMCLQRPEM